MVPLAFTDTGLHPRNARISVANHPGLFNGCHNLCVPILVIYLILVQFKTTRALFLSRFKRACDWKSDSLSVELYWVTSTAVYSGLNSM